MVLQTTPSERDMSSPAPKTAEVSWRLGLQSLTEQHGYVPLQTFGTLPAELSGTLVRNGPGYYDRFGTTYQHLFDGDGAVSAVRLHQGKAEGAVRVVQSKGLLVEEAMGERVFGTFGTRAPKWGTALRHGMIKNVANTNVIAWQGRLLALCESHGPTQVSMQDLATIGATDLGGVVRQSMTAHPHRVSGDPATYAFGMRYGLNTYVDLYRLPDSGRATWLGSVRLSGPTPLHDFAVTPTSFVFICHPMRVDWMSVATGLKAPADAIRWADGTPTEIVVVDRADVSNVRRYHTEAFFSYHTVNAYDEGGTTIVDLICFPSWDTDLRLSTWRSPHGEIKSEGQLKRLVVHHASRQVSLQPLTDCSCEFPRVSPHVDGQHHRYIYAMAYPSRMTGHSRTGIMKFDTKTATQQVLWFPRGAWPSEPIFVPRPGASNEDDGWILTFVYRGSSHTTELQVVKADDWMAGCVGGASFGHQLPMTFHGNWVPANQVI
jgi:all-trans-8'-apo-beta-carotenal 15,15'-oxygenase